MNTCVNCRLDQEYDRKYRYTMLTKDGIYANMYISGCREHVKEMFTRLNGTGETCDKD